MLVAGITMHGGQPLPSPGRVLLAPDSFKGSLSNIGVAQAMAAACTRLWPGCTIDLCPVADGGEGTLEALKAPWRLSSRCTRVDSPIRGQPEIEAAWALGGAGDSLAVVELAEVAGLGCIPPQERDPERASTHGLGELMRRALEKNVRELTVALGGSCTVDGGAGALGALGVTFRDGSGEAIETPIRGGDLQRIAGVEIPESLVRAFAQIRLRIAVDVNNPLLGEQGAARTYGPQKGATDTAVARLEAGLANIARLLEQDPMVPGTGAAGGVPIGLKGVLGGVIEGGLDLVLDACDFDERCRRADLVLTGEGALDGQSRMGKAAVGVALRAQHHGVPAIAVVGSRREDFGEPAPFAGIIALDEHVPEQEAMAFPAASIMHGMEAVLG